MQVWRRMHLSRVRIELIYTCCDNNFWHVVSGHIDVRPDKKRFNSVSYLGTPFFEEP